MRFVFFWLSRKILIRNLPMPCVLTSSVNSPNKFNSDEWYTNDISWMVAYKSKKGPLVIRLFCDLRFTKAIAIDWNVPILQWNAYEIDVLVDGQYCKMTIYIYIWNEEKKKKPIRLFICLFISVCFVSARLLGKCWLNEVFVFLSSFCFVNNALEIFNFSFVF